MITSLPFDGFIHMSALGYKIYPDANPAAPPNGKSTSDVSPNTSAFCYLSGGYTYDSDMWFAFKIKSSFDCTNTTCNLRIQTCANRVQSSTTFFRGQQTR